MVDITLLLKYNLSVVMDSHNALKNNLQDNVFMVLIL